MSGETLLMAQLLYVYSSVAACLGGRFQPLLGVYCRPARLQFRPAPDERAPARVRHLEAVNIALISLGRAAGAWVASRFFYLGASQTILFNALAAVGFNLLALSCLRKVEYH